MDYPARRRFFTNAGASSRRRAGEIGVIPAALATRDGEAVAIRGLDGLKLKPVRVFNL